MIHQRIMVLARGTSLVRQVQAAAGAGCRIVHHDRITDIDDRLQADGPFDLLIAGPMADSRTSLARLAKLRLEHPDLSVVLAMTAPLRSTMSEIVRVGAVDFLPLPSETKLMRVALRRALSIRPTVPAEIAVAVPSARPLAEVLTVASPSGGCGKTFYSTNLAHFLASTTGQRVCLVDLDLQFGEVSAALRLRPRLTVTDTITRGGLEEGDLEDDIESYLTPHPSGLSVLAAPRNPAEADHITPPDVSRVITALRPHFDYLVLDTSAQLSEIVLAAMDQSTALFCMSTLDLPSIRNMRVFLETLDRLQVPTDAVSVILNKVDGDSGLKVEEANEALYGKIVSVLPYAREVTRSINEGVPVLASAPKAPISQRLVADIQARLCLQAPPAATESVPGGGSARRSVLARLRRGGPKASRPQEPVQIAPPRGDAA